MKLNKSLLLFTILTILLSCKDFSSVREPHSLYIHLSAEPGTLNPITATDAYENMINRNIYETLLDRDYETLELIPQLAERWEISTDKLRFRFHLKRGVLWSDGVEFTSDDIIYSFNLIKDPKVACAQLKVYYVDVKRVKRIDKYTVEFQYSRPYFLALEFCGGIPIVPKHIFDDGTDFNTHRNNRFPIGTGPYKFERWDTGKKIILTLNDRYRGEKPEIKKVVYKLVLEVNIALQMLKKGELDVMSLRSIQWVRQTNSERFLNRFYKLKYYLPSYNYIGWNARREFFKDRRVRLALTHLIDREEILKKLMFGLGKIVTGNFYINSKSYNQKIKKWPFDPEMGKKLLKEAGWVDTDENGIIDKKGKEFSFTFTIPSGSKFSERLTSILKEDLSKVGIEMDINKYEWAVFVEKLHKRDFDAVTLSWSLGYSGDPYQLWHSSQLEKGSNFCYFKNAEADYIIEKARKEFNETKRIEMYHRFHEIIHYEQPYTFLYCSPALVVVSKRFENVKAYARGLKYMEWRIRN
ncbi:MAG: peptide-binding protein [Spirochaetota bacterium]|nr:peptide-binding protein [Spirochaetota bacterium]